MKRILTFSFVTLIFFNLAFAQKRTTILGDAWTGEVVATNDSTREITIKYEYKGKIETFVGILDEGYKVKMKDGSSHELRVSEIPAGTRIRIFSKAKGQDVGGRKVKINRIFRIDFLGKDEFSRLREALNLEPSFPAKLNESGSLSAANPLKMYLAIEDGDHQAKTTFMAWVSKWNKEQAAKYGSLEIVSGFAEAQVALVVLNGAENLAVTPFMIGADGMVHNFPPITVFLVSPQSNGLEVLWKQVFLTRPVASQTAKGRIEKEVEKRMKARSKK